MSAQLKIVLFGLGTIVLSVLLGYFVVSPALIRGEEREYVRQVNMQFELYHNNVEQFQNDMRYSIIILETVDEIFADSSNFTNYMTAYDDGFTYAPTPAEQAIISSLLDFALTNPYVESIYIGYEDTGAFVRTGPIQSSHPAGEGFNYDPRERTWYVNAVEHPGEIVFNDIEKHPTADEYFSTVSTALYDDDEQLIGVIGVDIIMANYIDNFKQVEYLSQGQFIYTQGANAVVFDEQNRLEILGLDELYDGFSVIQDTVGSDTLDVKLEGTNYKLIVYQVHSSSIRFVHMVEQSQIRALALATIAPIRNMFIAITLTLIGIMLFIVNIFAIRPLGAIEQQIKWFKKTDLEDFKFAEYGSKEFVQIARVLNSMLQELHSGSDHEETDVEPNPDATTSELEDQKPTEDKSEN